MRAFLPRPVQAPRPRSLRPMQGVTLFHLVERDAQRPVVGN